MKKFLTLALSFMLIFSGTMMSAALTSGDYAGSGEFSYKDGSLKDSSFRFPQSMLAGPGDSIYVVDTFNNVIRFVKPDSVVTLNLFSKSVDPSGFPFGGYADGNLKKALFNRPKDLAMDSKNCLYVTDSRNNNIRKIIGQKVYTFAGKGKAGYQNGSVQTAQFNNPSGITIDELGNVYVADSFNNAIRKITPKGEVSTAAGGGPSKAGYKDDLVAKALFNEPQDVVYDKKDKSLYVADTGNGLIRKIKDGRVTTVAGKFTGLDKATQYANGGYKDGFLKVAEFKFPKSIVMNSDGTLLVADTGNRAVRVIKGNRVDTLNTSSAGVLKQPTGLLIIKNQLYLIDDGDNKIKTMMLDLSPYGSKVPTMVVKGKTITFKSAAYADETGMKVPLKEIVAALNGQTKWDNKTKTIQVQLEGKKWVVTIEEGLVTQKGIAYVDVVKMGLKLGLKASYDENANAGLWQ